MELEDLKEVVDKAKKKVEDADSRKWELVNELNKLEAQLANIYKTNELIAFLDGMVRIKSVIKRDFDDYIMVSGYNFGSSTVHLTGHYLNIQKHHIRHYINGSEMFKLNENTIEDILNSTLSLEDQLYVKDLLSKWQNFDKRMNKEEETI